MTFKPDSELGVFENSDNYQSAVNNYSDFLGSHPVWGYRPTEATFPIKVERELSVFKQKVWWPEGKATLYQYCECKNEREGVGVGGKRVRRNECMVCGYYKYKEPGKEGESTEYFWDPVEDGTKGLPARGAVVTNGHSTSGFHYDDTHKHYELLSDQQKAVGLEKRTGGGGDMGASYTANADTRQKETSFPDGPASVRAKERGRSNEERLATDKREKAKAKAGAGEMSESQRRTRAGNRERAPVEGMEKVYEWEVGESMPYGDRDTPSVIVEGEVFVRFL